MTYGQMSEQDNRYDGLHIDDLGHEFVDYMECGYSNDDLETVIRDKKTKPKYK